MQNEIFNANYDEVQVTQDTSIAQFQLAPVTRTTLALYRGWPASGAMPWINRVRQPANQIIAAGDALNVTIWDTEQDGLLVAEGKRTTTLPELRVNSAGQVHLPYVGRVRVSGMSPDRARDVIEEKYREVTPTAQIQLTSTAGRRRSVSLVGGVGAPGTYPMPDQDYTLLGLLADGGGVSHGMKNPQVRLHRGGRIFGLPLNDLYGAPQRNTTLRGGDKVIVEEEKRVFLSLGAAGTETIHPFPNNAVSALEAISIMGGVQDTRADAAGVLILRSYPRASVGPNGPSHERVVFTLNLTSADGLFSAGEFQIQPNDLVYVTESPVTAVRDVLSVIGQYFGVALQEKQL